MFKKQDGMLLGAAGISFVLSVSLWFSGHQAQGQFVGLWVPSILAFGVYINVIRILRS